MVTHVGLRVKGNREEASGRGSPWVCPFFRGALGLVKQKFTMKVCLFSPTGAIGHRLWGQ